MLSKTSSSKAKRGSEEVSKEQSRAEDESFLQKKITAESGDTVLLTAEGNT